MARTRFCGSIKNGSDNECGFKRHDGKCRARSKNSKCAERISNDCAEFDFRRGFDTNCDGNSKFYFRAVGWQRFAKSDERQFRAKPNCGCFIRIGKF